MVELRGLLDRQIDRLRSAKNLVHEVAQDRSSRQPESRLRHRANFYELFAPPENRTSSLPTKRSGANAASARRSDEITRIVANCAIHR
jgi:hypothetical protein